MIYYILYSISIFLSLWTSFFGLLIRSDIPPNFSQNEVLFFYISFITSMILWFITVKISKKIAHHMLILGFISPLTLFSLYGYIHKKAYYEYYNKPMMLMDIVFLLGFSLIAVYSIYLLAKQIISKKSC